MPIDRDLNLRDWEDDGNFYECPCCNQITHKEDLNHRDHFDEWNTEHYTTAHCPNCDNECESDE